MKIFAFDSEIADPITQFESCKSASVYIAQGSGALNVYCVYIDPEGSIGEHPSGFCQIFLAVRGTGWISGSDRVRVLISAGQGAYLEEGELHSKGSESE